MALQIWLPLNGNLDNKGLSGNINISAQGTITYDNSGKIGKCLTTGGTSQTTNGIQLNTTLLDILNNPNGCSISIWVKPVGTHVHYNGTFISSGNWNNLCWAFGVSQDNTKVDVLSRGYNKWIDCAIPVNEWTHLTCTYTNGTSKLYKNGEYIGEKTGFSEFATDAQTTSIGRETYANGYFGFNGRINDVRIYDHCLSPKEVKEISKALVLHYPLNESVPTNLNPYILSDENYVQTNYAGRTTSSIINGVYHVNGYQETTSADTSFLAETRQYITLQANTDYYLSFYCKSNSDNSLFFGTSGQSKTSLISNNNVRCYPSSQVTLGNNYLGFVILKIHTTTDTQYKIDLGFDGPNIYGVGSFIEFSNVMLSLQEPTQYVPYTNGSVNSQIFDMSGYGNHGNLVGQLTIDNDTPKYNYCSYLAQSGAINCGRGGMVTDSITVNVWVKYSTYSNIVSCTESGGWNFENNSGLTFPIYIQSVGYVHIAAASRPNPTTYANNWHMFTGIYDRINKLTKLYIDGVLIGTGTVSASNLIVYNASNVIWLNAEATSSNTTANYGNSKKYSDFRIYATALSADDVKELYNTSSFICNNGSLEAYLFNENTSNLFTIENWNVNARYNQVNWVDRNGELAVQLNANNFYYGANDTRNNCLSGLFKQNTQYLFDMWIDYDAIVYNGNNVQGGITIYYTDNTTSTALNGKGNNASPIGWQHKLFYSDPTKSISHVCIYYYTGTGAFYRWDSIITPVSSEINIQKSGVLNGSIFNENSDIVQIHKGGTVDSSQFIEI